MGQPYPYLDAPRPLAFAHRGGAASRPENTLAAFAHAVALGYRYLETDVRGTRDGVAVLLHDPDLRRLAGDPAAVADLTWRELTSVRLAGATAVPRLDDVLAAWPAQRFNVDVKADSAVAPTAAALARTAGAGQVLLASFSDPRLAALRKLVGPAVPTSLGRRGVARLRCESLLRVRTGRWMPATAAAVQAPLRRHGVPVVDRGFVRHAHRLGRQVHVWTVDDPGTVHRLLDLGVDGIMTDRLEMLRAVYRQRGCWWPA